MATTTSALLNDVFFGPGFKDIGRFMVGIDEQVNRLNRAANLVKTTSNFPPYNIIRYGENSYRIEIAVAGYGETDIDIELKDGHLNIHGEIQPLQERESEEYLFKGIANRSFTRAFVLDEHVEVRGASMINGMLVIELERVIPEHMKPRKIEVRRIDSIQEPQLLTEG